MSLVDRNIALRSALVASAAFALQGCIAAAFPVVAGGLMAGEGRLSGSSDPDTTQATTSTQEEMQSPASEANEDATLALGAASSTTAEPVGAIAAATPAQTAAIGTSAQAEAPAPVRIVSSSPSTNGNQDPDAAVEVTDAGPALASANEAMAAAEVPAVPDAPVAAVPAQPRPVAASEPETASAEVAAAAAEMPASPPSTGGLVPVQDAPPATAGGTFFDPLFNYAASPTFVGNGDRNSAVLVDALSLSLDRQKCADGRSTVLIDLDPQDGKLFPIDTRSASIALARSLTDLRLIGITIAWISQSNIDQEDEIRSALQISGLDPLGNDRVLLMRNSDERKQLRREQLAGTSCLIAIAGDERSDFHELYDYLLNPTDAQALEPLIGEGWFLIPTPLISERPQ